jgi:hypothetical protein
MAGDNDKTKKGFSGLLDLVSEVSDINEPIQPEPKAEAIVDVDVKKESREASQRPRVMIDPPRSLPTPDTVRHADSAESEGSGAYTSFALMIGLLIVLSLIFGVLSNLDNTKKDRVPTSSETERSSRTRKTDSGNGSTDFPIRKSAESTVSDRTLSQENSRYQNSQGSVALPKAEGKSSSKNNQSQAPAGSGRTENRLLFSGNGTGQARVVRVDSGAVVLSDGRRYSITQLASSDFSHLMNKYDARSIGFEMPHRFIEEEMTWWDNSLTHSRRARFFAKSGTAIILLSKEKKYHYIEYSKLSAVNRSYIDSIDFSRPSKDPFWGLPDSVAPPASDDPFDPFD